jgi:AraC-like DNA-binding protein
MSEEATTDTMNPQQAEREAQRAQANRAELVERIARAVQQDGRVEPLTGPRLHRASSSTEPVYGVSNVRYNDASHFNRDYKRLFGLPPLRDVERLRGAAGQSTVG